MGQVAKCGMGLLTGLILTTGARAQAPPPDKDSSNAYTIIPYVIYTAPADLGDDAEMTIWRAGTGFDVMTPPLTEKMGLRLSILAEYSNYDFDSAASFIGVNKESVDAYIVRFAPAISYRHDDRISLFGGPIVELGQESGADFGDSLTYGGFGSMRYKVNEKFAFSLGATAKTSLEDDVSITPIGGVEFKFADDLVVGTSGAQLGFNVRVGKKISEKLALSVFAGYQNREYRLNDENIVPDGVLRDSRVPVGLEVDWRPSEAVVLRASGGVVAWQKTQIDDQNGGDVFKEVAEPTFFMALSASMSF